MAVRLSSTLFRSRTSSGCASVTFLRSALALFASAVILSWLGHLWLGVVVIPFFKQRSLGESEALGSYTQRIHRVSRAAASNVSRTRGSYRRVRTGNNPAEPLCD